MIESLGDVWTFFQSKIQNYFSPPTPQKKKKKKMPMRRLAYLTIFQFLGSSARAKVLNYIYLVIISRSQYYLNQTVTSSYSES